MSAVDRGVHDRLQLLYRDFNARKIDDILDAMVADVRWPNGWEGGYLVGHDEVRSYWTRQWAEIDPTVTPTGITLRSDGRIDVTVHQVVRDMTGALLVDDVVHHVYRLRAGQIESMDIES
jgi:hypothetical protein